MKKTLGLLARILEGLTYFVPDVVLVLAVLSAFYFDFGTHDILITIGLFLAYLGLAYGEHYYHKVRFVEETIQSISEQLSMEQVIYDYKLVNLETLINVVEIMTEDYENRLEELREELAEGDVDGDEMDKEKQHQDQ